MAKGFDVSNPLTPSAAARFAANGFEFVCRYLAPASWKSWKALTANEAQIITNAGLQIVSVWETTAGAAGNGASEGRDAGIFALQAAKEVGQPEGTKIYFAVDFDPAPSQYGTIADYFIAADQEIDGYEIDAYGNKAIIDYLQSRGIIRNGWQTFAWSHNQRSSQISIYQSTNDVIILGIQADNDESFGNEGWWNLMAINKPAINFDKITAQKVIDVLGALYNASDNKGVMEAAHYAADALRDATGIQKQ